jgi:hypothetical protein
VSPATAAAASVEAIGSTFEGNSGAANTGIIASSGSTGARGKYVTVIDCEFKSYGQTGSNLSHGMYIYNDFDLTVLGCRFLSSYGNGYGVQIYDTSVSAANGSKARVIDDCFFAPGLSSAGIVTGAVGATMVRNCVFENAQVAINSAGRTDIDGCLFAGSNAAVGVIGNFGGWTGRVTNCRFIGSGGSGASTRPARY